MTSLTDAQVAGMTPQLRLIYEYLMTGRSLTGLIAMTTLQCTSLTTRIAELRGMGMRIDGEWREDHSGRRYKLYRAA